MYTTLMSQKHEQMRDQGRGVSLPYARLQDPFTNTENTLDFSSEKANTQKVPKLNKRRHKRGQTRPKRGRSTPNTKETSMKDLKNANARLFFSYTQSLNQYAR